VPAATCAAVTCRSNDFVESVAKTFAVPVEVEVVDEAAAGLEDRRRRRRVREVVDPDLAGARARDVQQALRTFRPVATGGSAGRFAGRPR
jgi:hypothetical protein